MLWGALYVKFPATLPGRLHDGLKDVRRSTVEVVKILLMVGAISLYSAFVYILLWVPPPLWFWMWC